MKECNQCGKCCKNYSNGGLSATAAEIGSWDAFRPDIYSYVGGEYIWMSPDTGQQLELCPWLRELPDQRLSDQKLPDQKKYTCDIYHDRPGDCRYYPVTIEQMIEDECEMLEAKDLLNPKQAQKKLDMLMADSRPALER